MIRTFLILAIGAATYYAYRFYRLQSAVQTLGHETVALNPERNMANDPIQELAAIKSGYEALVSKVTDLTSALAAAQQAQPSSDFVTSDVQSALDALNAEVAAQGAAPSAPAPATPAAS